MQIWPAIRKDFSAMARAGRSEFSTSARAAARAKLPPLPIAAIPSSGSITSPEPLIRKVCFRSATTSSASRLRSILSVRQSLANSTAERPRSPAYCSSLASKRLKSEKASAVEPANPARILSWYKRRIFLAVCLITPSPSVTCPSPAITTWPSLRTQRTVVERTKRFFVMSAIFYYSSGTLVPSAHHQVCYPRCVHTSSHIVRANDVRSFQDDGRLRGDGPVETLGDGRIV